MLVVVRGVEESIEGVGRTDLSVVLAVNSSVSVL